MPGDSALLVILPLLVRVVFFLYGIYQDGHYKVRYTDIDYFVFNDAAGYVYEWIKHGSNGSPYQRDTYRYTPLLSWLLVPNHYFGWFHLGKMVFIAFDLFTGMMIQKMLVKSYKTKSRLQLLLLNSIWLLNPMVITISTRGNAESVLTFLIMLSLFYLQKDKLMLSGLIHGLAIHFKIYPIIYCLPIAIYIYQVNRNDSWFRRLFIFGISTLVSLACTSALMYRIYGAEYFEHAYWYHLYRTDHRHNFSLWNLLLYFDSARPMNASFLSKIAFVPQMSVVFGISLLQFKQATFSGLLVVLFIQTFAFVTYNKVCTSQYFVWYLIFLPFYLANTTIRWKNGAIMITAWIGTQALWLLQGFLLEFEGKNVFYPNMFLASASFFIANVWIIGEFIADFKRSSFDIDIIKKTK